MARRITRVPAPMPATSPDLEFGWTTVHAAWHADRRLSEQTVARFTELGRRFVLSLAAQGCRNWDDVDAAACTAFVTAPTRSGGDPRPGTQHTRRAAVRAIFRTLRIYGLVDGDPTLDERIPPRTARDYRPLRDAEIELGRAACRLGGGARSLARAVAWALAETGATTGEIPLLRVADLDHPRHPSAVSIPESHRFAARTAPLSDWGATVLSRHLAAGAPSPNDLIAYEPRGEGGAYRGQASVATNLTRVLDLAGLRRDPRVRARSIRGWAGRRAYDDGAPLEAVAALLGCRSLDTAAADIGLAWPATPTTSGGAR